MAKTRWPVSAAVRRDLDRLEVAHLADQDDVGVLPQGRAESGREALGVATDLSLVDNAALVVVQELDRVLDGDDVVCAALVDLVDDRRECGGLAGACRAGDQNEPSRLVAEGMQHLGESKLVDGLDVDRDESEGGAQRPSLEEDVHAEARLAVQRVGEVDLPLGLELLPLVLVEDAVDELAGLVGRKFRVPL